MTLISSESVKPCLGLNQHRYTHTLLGIDWKFKYMEIKITALLLINFSWRTVWNWLQNRLTYMLSINLDPTTSYPRVFKRHIRHIYKVVHCFITTSSDSLTLLLSIDYGLAAWASPGSLQDLQDFRPQSRFLNQRLHCSKNPRHIH